MSQCGVKKKVIVTGAAGFIGSHLVDELLKSECQVFGIDNTSTGKYEFLKSALSNSNFEFIRDDLLTSVSLHNYFEHADTVYHLAANADVRFGKDHPRRDLEQNTIVTHNVLEASRIAGVKKFAFSSTGSVYGEARIFPTPEDAPFPLQTSLYGASKLASEGLVQAYTETFGIQSWIFRFVSMLGPRYTHGHIFDFYKQLIEDPTKLKVLGNGHQNKSYLHVSDCISAIKIALAQAKDNVNIFNLGSADSCEVRDSIKWIIDEMGVNPTVEYGIESRGWIGDNPLIQLETTKIESLGWKPKYSIEEAVRDTVRYLCRAPELI